MIVIETLTLNTIVVVKKVTKVMSVDLKKVKGVAVRRNVGRDATNHQIGVVMSITAGLRAKEQAPTSLATTLVDVIGVDQMSEQSPQLRKRSLAEERAKSAKTWTVMTITPLIDGMRLMITEEVVDLRALAISLSHVRINLVTATNQ